MSNPFSSIEHGIEVAAKDTFHVAEKVISVGQSVVKLIEDAKALTPEFKQDLATLVNDAAPIAASLAPVIATGGSNALADVNVIQPVFSDLVKLVSDFLRFVPTIESAMKQLGADVTV